MYRAWSLSIGRLPRFSRDTKLVSKPGVVDHIERSAWMPYTDDGIYLSLMQEAIISLLQVLP